MVKITKIFVDMDGVLCDFVGATYKVFNMRPEWPNGFGFYDLHKVLGVTEAGMWSKIRQVPYFWDNLPTLHHFNELLAVLDDYKVTIATSPTKDPMCAAGKMAWIQRYMPVKYHRKFMIGTEKHELAGPTKLLIDDGEHNIDAFAKAGGCTFLWPQPWNAAHRMYDGITALKEYLDAVAR